jgi:hypothetical protein
MDINKLKEFVLENSHHKIDQSLLKPLSESFQVSR